MQQYGFLSELKMFPYKLQIDLELSESDENNRLPFAEKVCRKLWNDCRYLKRIVFCDE